VIVRIVNAFISNSLCVKDFPRYEFHSLVLYALVKSISKTEDTPHNLKREIGVGSYAIFPQKLGHNIFEKLKTYVEQYKIEPIASSKVYLLAKLMITMEEENMNEGRKIFCKLVAKYNFIHNFEVSVVVGYGLLLKESREVISILHYNVQSRNENWIVYYHYAIAYTQMKKYREAIEITNLCLKIDMILQWITVDHRAHKFLQHMCRIAKIIKDFESLSIYIQIIKTAKWSKYVQTAQ
jgi:hypothetical protein